MKKILFAIVAIAFVLVSCNKGKEAKNLSITMEITSEPTVAGVSIKCTPSDSSIYYSLTCVPTDSLANFDIDAMSAEVYAVSDEVGFDKIAIQGVYTFTYAGELEPSTTYTPVAFQIDEKKRVYKTLFTGPEFTTQKLPVSTMKINITYDGKDDLTFTPTENEAYVAFVVDSTLLYYWGYEDYGYFDKLGEFVLDVYAYDPNHENTYYGTQTLKVSNNVYGTPVPGDHIYVLAAPVCESHINGEMTAKNITLGSSSNVAPRAFMPRSINCSALRVARKH